MRNLITALALLLAPLISMAAGEVESVEATFEPAEAKPGQTVLLKVKVVLKDGWQTYPTVQPDPAARSMSNKFTFPEKGDLIFVGKVSDPENAKEKSDQLLGIEKLLYYPGGGTFTRAVVVSPTAKPGDLVGNVKFRLMVCDKDNCLPPTLVELKPTLKVAGEAVAVEAKYDAEVKKALAK